MLAPKNRVSKRHALSLSLGLATAAAGCSPSAKPANDSSRPARTVLIVAPDSPSEPAPAPPAPTIAAESPGALAFALPGLNSETARLRPAVVNVVAFGASWCTPCKLLYPVLDSLHRRRGIDVNVVLLQEDDDRASAAGYVSQLAIAAAAAWDQDGTVAKAWKLDILPAVYVVDKHGKIRFRHAGYDPGLEETLERETRELAAER
jgi:thiol-disulfide isomerase/thioredoxin